MATLWTPGETGVRASIYAPGGPITPAASDVWEFYDEAEFGDLAPIDMGAGNTFYDLTLIPYADGTSRITSDGSGNNNGSVSASNMRIPLESLNPVPTIDTGYTWVPTTPGDASPEIIEGVPEAAVGTWDAITHYIQFPTADIPISGWTGGILTLYENNSVSENGRKLVITFLPMTSDYPPVSAEYVD